MSTVRTRFAPSPTGYLHVGNIRTGFFAWLVARHAGGQFVLRLEDTDKKREVAGADAHLIASLKALGVDWDEGFDIGGPSPIRTRPTKCRPSASKPKPRSGRFCSATIGLKTRRLGTAQNRCVLNPNPKPTAGTTKSWAISAQARKLS